MFHIEERRYQENFLNCIPKLEGKEVITTYTFNTHVAKHTFCKICGVQSFYRPRSNPDGYGVMPHCLDPGTVEEVITEHFTGSQWEKSMQEAGESLSGRSKPTD